MRFQNSVNIFDHVHTYDESGSGDSGADRRRIGGLRGARPQEPFVGCWYERRLGYRSPVPLDSRCRTAGVILLLREQSPRRRFKTHDYRRMGMDYRCRSIFRVTLFNGFGRSAVARAHNAAWRYRLLDWLGLSACSRAQFSFRHQLLSPVFAVQSPIHPVHRPHAFALRSRRRP